MQAAADRSGGGDGSGFVVAGVYEPCGEGDAFADISGWFCYQNLCPMVVGSKIVFLDEGHVTQTYANQLEPQVAALLPKLLR